MKTNKSFTSRLKVTKQGKVLARKPGQNHFNAKEDRRSQLHKKKMKQWSVANDNKVMRRFLPRTK